MARTGNKSFSVVSGKQSRAQKIILYGPGGIGKSELCSLLSQAGRNPLFFDVDNGTAFIDVPRIKAEDLSTFMDVRAAMQNTDLRTLGHDMYVVDTVTKVEELGSPYVVANYKDKKGHSVSSIDGFDFGQGYEFRHNEMLKFLSDCDEVVRAGISVVLIAQETTAKVPNPAGVDFIRWEPRLYRPAQPGAKCDTRAVFKEWADHVLFIGYDVDVSKDGKGTGGGSRMIYTSELPTHMAKTRSLTGNVAYEKGSAEIWKLIFQGN